MFMPIYQSARSHVPKAEGVLLHFSACIKSQEVQGVQFFFSPRGPKRKVLLYLQSVNIQANYLCKIMKEINFDKGPGNAHYTYIGTDLNFPVYFNRKYSVR